MADPQTNYNPKLAWKLAMIYFVACFLISQASGVLPALITTPLFTQENISDPAWVFFTLLCLAVIIVGYFFVWPRGTFVYGRKLYWSVVIIFGLLWGLSEGQLIVSIWSLVNRFTHSNIIIIAVTFIIISIFNGMWHSLYWDIYIAPPHNDPAWNLKKVLFAHVPNLIITLTYLTIYENMGMFILFQTIALVASTYFMHFPPFWVPAENNDNLTPKQV